jgi:hypothetical protein
MSFGDVMAIVLSTRADEPRACRRGDIVDHTRRSCVRNLGQRRSDVEPVDSTTVVVTAAAAGAWSEPPVVPRLDADDEHVRLIRRLKRFPRPVRIERVEYVEAAGAELVGVQSRRSGLTILLRPRAAPSAPLRTAMFERVLSSPHVRCC